MPLIKNCSSCNPPIIYNFSILLMTRWYPQIIMLELNVAEEWPQRQGKLLRQVALVS